jgi:hypothetical protein
MRTGGTQVHGTRSAWASRLADVGRFLAAPVAILDTPCVTVGAPYTRAPRSQKPPEVRRARA